MCYLALLKTCCPWTSSTATLSTGKATSACVLVTKLKCGACSALYDLGAKNAKVHLENIKYTGTATKGHQSWIFMVCALNLGHIYGQYWFKSGSFFFFFFFCYVEKSLRIEWKEHDFIKWNSETRWDSEFQLDQCKYVHSSKKNSMYFTNGIYFTLTHLRTDRFEGILIIVPCEWFQPLVGCPSSVTKHPSAAHSLSPTAGYRRE